MASRRNGNDCRSTPRYELRASRPRVGELLLEVWQLPSAATPDVRHPRYIGGLGGRNLALMEPRLLKKLRNAGIEVSSLRGGESRRFDVDEAWALRLGLMFRALAPMRHRGYMRSCTEGIEAMPREEAAYWLGMTMHRRRPRRVLMALRALLTDSGAR
jgi:hypothetical protein